MTGHHLLDVQEGPSGSAGAVPPIAPTTYIAPSPMSLANILHAASMYAARAP